MELYIRILNGQPFEHPILGDNFRQAFPEIDVTNLPPEFAKFERIVRPRLGVYEVYEGVTYELDGGAYKDVHHVRQMTEQERAEKIATVMAVEHPADWVFDKTKCDWVPPSADTTTSGNEPNVIG
jgi:hypothetical protein